MVYISSIRELDDLNHIAKRYLSEWLKHQHDEGMRVFYSSFVSYSINERKEAIRQIEKYLEHASQRSSVTISLKYNLLYYLIEEAGCFPDKAAEAKQKCDALMSELEARKWRQFPKAMARDTKGYYLIIFGTDLSEIRDGIRICQKTRTKDSVARSYLEIHEAIGWRRYVTLDGDVF